MFLHPNFAIGAHLGTSGARNTLLYVIRLLARSLALLACQLSKPLQIVSYVYNFGGLYSLERGGWLLYVMLVV